MDVGNTPTTSQSTKEIPSKGRRQRLLYRHGQQSGLAWKRLPKNQPCCAYLVGILLLLLLCHKLAVAVSQGLEGISGFHLAYICLTTLEITGFKSVVSVLPYWEVLAKPSKTSYKNQLISRWYSISYTTEQGSPLFHWLKTDIPVCCTQSSIEVTVMTQYPFVNSGCFREIFMREYEVTG